ncbi:MAG: hypothetical protein HY591_03410 [Candidatus Omnitrophica bacterium]|nr:hypothetical protein [Candidatus Omnitrophota bacterium]
MKTSIPSTSRGQAALEYLLLCGLVAFVVFLAFSPGGFLSQVQVTSQDYFDKVAQVIVNSDQGAQPAPINGAWCPWAACTDGIQFRTCECPSPAFGGNPCSGASRQNC